MMKIPSRQPSAHGLFIVVFLVSVAGLVHGFAAHAATQGNSASGQKAATRKTSISRPAVVLERDVTRLPEKVQAMRDAILAAAISGDIEGLRIPLEWNELKPEIDGAQDADPVKIWRDASSDGQGREILAILHSVLDAGYTVLNAGKSNELYVWPAYAELALDTLSPADEVQLYRLIPAAQVKIMREKGQWSWYRLAIGRDGTWHSFKKSD